MSQVILYIAASIDGFIAGPDGDISWLKPFETGPDDYGFSDFYSGIGASLMGSKTYEKSLSLKGGIDPVLPTFVLTKQKWAPARTNITFYSGDLSAVLDLIRSQTSKNIWLVGGGQLTRSFLREGLIDEIILSIVPVFLGKGIPLFQDIQVPLPIQTIKMQKFSSGIVQIRYRVTDTTKI